MSPCRRLPGVTFWFQCSSTTKRSQKPTNPSPSRSPTKGTTRTDPSVMSRLRSRLRPASNQAPSNTTASNPPSTVTPDQSNSWNVLPSRSCMPIPSSRSTPNSSVPPSSAVPTDASNWIMDCQSGSVKMICKVLKSSTKWLSTVTSCAITDGAPYRLTQGPRSLSRNDSPGDKMSPSYITPSHQIELVVSPNTLPKPEPTARRVSAPDRLAPVRSALLNRVSVRFASRRSALIRSAR